MDQLGITIFDVAVIAVALFGAAIGMSAGFAHAVLFIASLMEEPELYPNSPADTGQGSFRFCFGILAANCER